MVAHAGLVSIVSAWMLGGIGSSLEWVVAAIASPSLWFLFAEARHRRRAGDRAGFRRMLRWTAPLALLALVVGASALNPSHRPAMLQGALILRPVPHVEWLPSSALPLDSLRGLACLGSLACVGLSLAFCVHGRRPLRALVLALAINALALAVFGTLQRQTGAAGPFFGALAAPNSTWFASFLYHNHWGAFAVLSAAASLGLVFHSLRQPAERGWAHGPGPLPALCAALVAASVPLSSSRSCTVLVLLIALCAAVATLAHLLRPARRGTSDRSRTRLAGGATLLAALLLFGGLVFAQSRDVLTARLHQTFRQLDPDIASRPDATLYEKASSGGYGRPELYADTWRLAAERPIFGWGLDSFGVVFLERNSIPDRLRAQNVFVDAHSDWLQSLAEIGWAGTALLLLFTLIPLAESFRPRRSGPFARWLLGGCALVAAYAWLEFPFANPAVVGLWWILFFCALRHHQLSPCRAARPALGSEDTSP